MSRSPFGLYSLSLARARTHLHTYIHICVCLSVCQERLVFLFLSLEISNIRKESIDRSIDSANNGRHFQTRAAATSRPARHCKQGVSIDRQPTNTMYSNPRKSQLSTFLQTGSQESSSRAAGRDPTGDDDPCTYKVGRRRRSTPLERNNSCTRRGSTPLQIKSACLSSPMLDAADRQINSERETAPID